MLCNKGETSGFSLVAYVPDSLILVVRVCLNHSNGFRKKQHVDSTNVIKKTKTSSAEKMDEMKSNNNDAR